MEFQERTMIKFNHEEVEALLRLIGDLNEDELNEHERSARVKLKKIFARQILSHEKRQREAIRESIGGENDRERSERP